MKIYLTNYDLSKRAGKTIYASQYSSFKAGIKVPGASEIKLFDGQTEISADASLFHGYKAFPLDAGDAGQKEYTVKADGSELRLKVVSTDSAAAELNDKDTVFDLPVATAETLGGVKVGPGLSVGADGTLSASGGSVPSDLSVDTLYSANIIRLANPEDICGVFISCDSNGYSQSNVNLVDLHYTSSTGAATEAYFELGNVGMGSGLRFQEDQNGALTCDIGANGLTADYVTTGGELWAPALVASDDGSGSEIATLGREDLGLYVKYDGQNSTMVGLFTELTCGQDAEFRANVAVDGDLTVGSSLVVTSGGAAQCEIAFDGLSFTDGSSNVEVFEPIAVTIGGLQYKVLGYAV